MSMKYDINLDMNNDNSSHVKILKQILSGSMVLECGCSTGNMTKYLKENITENIYIIEIDQMAYSVAAQYAKDGICTDLSKDKWVKKFSNLRFDYILFADVLEHLSNPVQVLKKATKLLKANGKILISLPNIAHNDILIRLFNDKWDYKDTGLLDKTHVRFFAADNLDKLCASAGLGIVRQDFTFRSTFNTEQRMYHDKRIEPLVQALKTHRFGTVYQFILTAQRCEYIKQNKIEKVVVYNADNNWEKREQDFLNLEKESGKLYLDDGNGFSERNVKYLNINDNGRVDAEIVVHHDIVNLRYDPVEDNQCIVSNLSITANGLPLNIVPINGVLVGDELVFVTHDPQIGVTGYPIGGVQAVHILADIVKNPEKFVLGLLQRYIAAEEKVQIEKAWVVKEEARVNELERMIRERKEEDIRIAQERMGRLYFNFGKGFSEYNSTIVELNTNSNVDAVIKLPKGLSGLRYDPIEGDCCIVKNLNIYIDGSPVAFNPISGYIDGDQVVFYSKDPQFYLEYEATGETELYISADIERDPEQIALALLSRSSKAEALTGEQEARAEAAEALAGKQEARAKAAEALAREQEIRAEAAEILAEEQEACAKVAETRLHEWEQQVSAIQSSFSYKLGRILTWLPRSVRYWWNRFKNMKDQINSGW